MSLISSSHKYEYYLHISYYFQFKGDQINTVMNDTTLTDDHVKEIEPIIIDAIKVSHCFPSKVCILRMEFCFLV
jgi:hypothetical protein